MTWRKFALLPPIVIGLSMVILLLAVSACQSLETANQEPKIKATETTVEPTHTNAPIVTRQITPTRTIAKPRSTEPIHTLTPSPRPSAATTTPTVEAPLALSRIITPIIPLESGTTWVYTSTIYDTLMDGEQWQTYTATYRITDTIETTFERDGYLVARAERSASLKNGEPRIDFRGIRPLGRTWYIANVNGIYLQYDPVVDLDAVESSWLEILLPLEAYNCWYPHATDRLNNDPTNCNRHLNSTDPIVTQFGVVEDCYTIFTFYLGGSPHNTFCTGVGMVQAEFHHSGTPFGYKETLIALHRLVSD